MVEVDNTRVNRELAAAEHILPATVSGNQAFRYTTCTPWTCQVKERRKFKVLIELFYKRINLFEVDTGRWYFGSPYQWSAPRDPILR